MCALYVNTSRERDGGAPAAEDTNIRDLVENCAHNDDITPLIRLMFEAQAVPESPTAIDGAAARRRAAGAPGLDASPCSAGEGPARARAADSPPPASRAAA